MATSKQTRTAILLEAADLQPGQTVTIVCPECGGGGSAERSCSITKKDDGRILWICFRDSCKIKGSSAASKGTALPKPEKQPKSPKLMRLETFMKVKKDAVPDALRDLAASRHSIDLREAFVRWTTAYSPEGKGRLAIPIFSKYMDLEGYDLKDILKEQSPKSLTLCGDYGGVAWYMHGFWPKDVLVIVEDLLSAIATRQEGLDAAALLGTHITQSMIDDINSVNYKTVLIALDNDAIGTATSIVAEGRIKNAKLLPLRKDIKNMTIEERRNLFADYITSSEPSK